MLELTEEERRLLVDILSDALSDLRSEVYKTENFEWREELKHREALLKGIIDRLTAVAPEDRPAGS